MPDHTRASTRINADPSAIMEVIADFPAYPEWAGMVKQAEILDVGPDGRPRQVRFLLDAGVVKDEYVLAYEWQGLEQVSWQLVRSASLRAQDGSYRLRESESGGTDVDYELSVELKMPVLGMLKRRAEKVIVDTALHGLKKRVESRVDRP